MCLELNNTHQQHSERLHNDKDFHDNRNDQNHRYTDAEDQELNDDAVDAEVGWRHPKENLIMATKSMT